MRDLGPVTLALTCIGAATAVLLLVGLAVGSARGDVAGTLGPVVSIGLGVTAVVVVCLLLWRSERSRD